VHTACNVNLILFDPAETGRPLPLADRRAVHILEVLRRKEGDTFDVGLVEGPRGKGKLARRGEDALEIEFTWGQMPTPLDPVVLILGLPRPQSARKVLQEATAVGVAQIQFVTTEKGDPSYGQSTLWTSGEWRRHVVAGAEQAFDTRLPEITHGRSLAETVVLLAREGSRLALDNYEAEAPLSSCAATTPVTLAIGPERGWSARERELLREHGFVFAHLGPRVLRIETALIAALALIKAKRGIF
jgi:16S rRNA (uracil1498-N3)-methyltransferase